MNVRPPPPKAQIPFKHAQCLLSNFHHKCLYGGSNGAKSWSAATYVIGRSRQKRELIVCFRQHQNALRDSSKALIENRIHDLGLDQEFWITNSFIRHVATGSEFLFLGLEKSIDSIRSLRRRHHRVDRGSANDFARKASRSCCRPSAPKGRNLSGHGTRVRLPTPVDKMFSGPLPRPDAHVSPKSISGITTSSPPPRRDRNGHHAGK